MATVNNGKIYAGSTQASSKLVLDEVVPGLAQAFRKAINDNSAAIVDYLQTQETSVSSQISDLKTADTNLSSRISTNTNDIRTLTDRKQFFIQNSAPAGARAGDIWFDTSAN